MMSPGKVPILREVRGTMTAARTSAFGAALRRHRLAAHLTQEELAALAGVSTRAISDLERGVNRTARKHTAQLLGAALDLAPVERDQFALLARGLASEMGLPSEGAGYRLPVPPAPLLGREADLARLTGLLRRAAVRLVVLTGPGGVGKTRIGIEAARGLRSQYPDGAAFVGLASVRDPQLVAPALAHALGVRPAPGQPPLTGLLQHLEQRRVLLILDNFEHVVEVAPLVAQLLEGCPNLNLLVTSRSSLRLRGEHDVPVDPLEVPEEDDGSTATVLAQSAPVALFITRARAVAADWPLSDAAARAVLGICGRLDGLPLAIELAAARSRLMPPTTMLTRLTDGLALPAVGARDAPDRQQTLRRSATWSYDLLSPLDKRVFRRMGVFVGGCQLEAAEQVCSVSDRPEDVLEGLAALVDSSLAQQRPGSDGPRLSMLETIREYAVERLDASGERPTVQARHALYFVSLAERAETELTGPEQATWLDRLEVEHGNVRAALEWSTSSGDAELGLRLAGALWRFWEVRGYVAEGGMWLQRVLDARGESAGPCTTKALNAAGNLARDAGDLELAALHHSESLDAARGAGDAFGVARALNNLGNVALDRASYGEAVARYETSLAEFDQLGDAQHSALVLNNLGIALTCLGRLAEAVAALKRSLRLARRLEDARGIAQALCSLGDVTVEAGHKRWASQCYEEALRLRVELGHRHGIGLCLDGFAAVAVGDGEPDRAARLFGAAEAVRELVGEPLRLAERTSHARAVAAARSALPPDRFSEAWNAGRARTLDEAVAEALAGTSRRSSPGRRPGQPARGT